MRTRHGISSDISMKNEFTAYILKTLQKYKSLIYPRTELVFN
jgi:hypothetical protein